MRRARTATLLALAVSLAGCGARHEKPLGRIAGRTLTVYVSVPLQGTTGISGKAIWGAAAMALQGIDGRIGRYQVQLKKLDDSTPARVGWDPGKTSDDARLAAIDPTAIGYVGDQESGASAISIPVLNRAGIAQVSPTSTAVGLTTAGPGAEPGEPEKYYPSGVRTFARVAASDAAQAAVQVRLQRRSGCRRTFVVDDGEVDGEDIATSFGLAARAAGLDVVATQQFDPRATDYRPLATSIASAGADCVLIAAITDSNALALTRQLAAARPSIRIFGSGGLADSSYAAGLPAPVSARVLITSPALGTEAYPSAARAFLSAYTRRYGPPEPDAILGYEAMRLMLDAISRATDGGRKEAERSKVVEALFATRARRSVLGTYGIRADGDTTSTRIGVWTVVAGRLRFRAAVDG